MVLLADAEEAAEGHHRIGHPSRELVDHQALDRADLDAVAVEHRGALDPVGGDQVMLGIELSERLLVSLGLHRRHGRLLSSRTAE